ncbi:MAG: hypothetical protein ACRDSP_19530 [Pseudonocardiaceae bacterium]
MSRHHRQRGLLVILARLGWQRDPSRWSVPCRDGHGCRAELSVRLGAGWVTLDCSAPGPLYLRPHQAGQARAALREAVLDLERLGSTELSDPAVARESALLAGGAGAVGQRAVVHWHQVIRPTVPDIEARLMDATADAAPEVDQPGSQLPGAAA